MERFFVSDHHLSHFNIIAYASRPFKTVREMDETLLANHNSLVKPQDHVSFLGDVTIRRGGRVDREWFVNEVRKYNGHKRLFLGNHDHYPIKVYLEAGFEKIYATWRDDEGILFSHFPLHARSLGSAIANVHGHIHAQSDYEPVIRIDKKTQRIVYAPYINISVERTNYLPIHIDDLRKRIEKAKGEYDGVKVGEEVGKSPSIRSQGSITTDDKFK